MDEKSFARDTSYNIRQYRRGEFRYSIKEWSLDVDTRLKTQFAMGFNHNSSNYRIAILGKLELLKNK